MVHHAQLPLWDNKSDTEKIETLHEMVMDLYRYQLGDVLDQIIQMLEDHIPADHKEQQDIAMMKQLIRQHPNIMNMNCEVGHLTASAIIVDIQSNRICLHFHKRLKRWLQVGGHADYETDMTEVALREAQEETGLSDLAFFPVEKPVVPLDYDVHTIPQNKNIPEHLHLDFRYVLTTNQSEQVSPESGESTDFKWLTFDEALALGDEIDYALQRLIRKAQKLFV